MGRDRNYKFLAGIRTAAPLILILILTYRCTAPAEKKSSANEDTLPVTSLTETDPGPSTSASPGISEPDPKALKKVQKRIQSWVQYGGRRGIFRSAAVGVVYNNKLIYEYHYRTGKKRAFGVASITKTFTGMAVMQLIDRGKIKLDDPISKFYPKLKIADPKYGGAPVLIRHLLSHTSGMPDTRFYRNPGWINGRTSGVGFALPRQRFPTGTYMAYSNHGMKLLGALVARVSGKSLGAYIKENIFTPLEMKSSGTIRNLSGAYGVNTSLRDLATWAKVWLNDGQAPGLPRILSAGTVGKMLKPLIFFPESENTSFMGLIWRTKQMGRRIAFYHHGGAATGSMAWMQMFPDQKAAILLVSNPGEITGEVLGWRPTLRYRLGDLVSLYAGTKAPVYQFNSSLPGPSTLSLIPGRYKDVLRGGEVRFEIKDKQLYRVLRNRRVRMRPKNTREYKLSKGWGTYEFLFEPGRRNPRGVATDTAYYERLPEGE